ncbi:MAG TPA: Calx-beta domain-containing protein, partial [Pyrinomonadaceae bacterium]|nr:Calx-beta domain-containing protein [Pyrinomonadaceae bacterium]
FGNQAMAIDAAKNRAYFLGDSVLRSYELDTFRPIASVTIQGIGNGTFDGPTSLIRWGKNGLAFRTTNRVFLIQTALVDASDPIPTATPTPSPTPSPTPVYVPTLVKKVDLAANDLVIDASTQILYASVPSTAGTLGNTITAVNPQTATVGQSAFVGSEPGLLAIAGDGQTLYVNLEGAKAVRRFDYLTMSPGLQFTVGVDRPFDMEVVPGSPQSLAVSRGTTFDNGVAVYDNGVKRPNSGTGNAYGIGPIEFGATPSVLYGYDSFSSGFELVKFQVDSAGVTALSTTNNLLSGYISSLEYSAGRLYSASGRVVDPEAKTLLGTFNAGGTEMLVDQTLGRVFFLSNGGFSGSNITLSAFDINTFLPLGSVTLGGVTGTPNGLVRWGANGLAFCTVKQQFDSSSTSQIYLVQSALVSNSVPIPSALQFGAANYSVFEGGGNNAVTVTVTRTGGVAGGTTVNYATGGGTATPGVDYTPASGTLTFADGETSKTFTVSVLDDNVFEGNETIGLTLTNPSGDASLGTLPTATLTIQDNESQPFVTTSNLFVPEGESGTKTVQLTVALSNATTKTVTFNYATANGTATAGSDYVATSGTLTFAPGETTKTIPVEIVGDAVEEPDEQFSVGFSNPTNVTLFGQTATITILADEKPFVQFAASTFNANEGSGRATITVTRFGPLTGAASVEYFTADDQRSIPCDPAGGSIIGLALARCDYATTYDTLTFAPGESSKTFTIPLIDDSYSESQERVQIVLFGAVGAALGSPSSAFLNINDNDSTSNQPNPLDANAFFVRQHYLDFLSREPDAEGLAAWTGVLDRCPNSRNTDPASPSAGCDQNIVSSSFFRSTEFQLKGYFVYRFYRVAFNRRPQYSEFIFDMRRVTGETADEVYTKRRAFSEAWVQRQEFTNFLGGLSNSLFVDTLLGRYGINAINTPDPATPDGDALVRLTRDGLVSALDAQPQRLTRAQVLRAIVQSREIDAAEYNGAFVAMQYYGYLRRAPEQSGYDAWLQVITRGDGYRVMVNGFMNSTEYRLRFGKP